MFGSIQKTKLEISHLHNKYSDPLLSTLLKPLWQRLQPQVYLGRTQQAWSTCIWVVLPILICRASQAVRLDGERRCTAIFMSLQRMFDQVQVRALVGPLKDIQRLVPKPLLRCLVGVLRVVVLSEGEPSPQAEGLSALE